MSSKETGKNNAFTIEESKNDDPLTKGLTALGLAGNDVTKVDAQDAVFKVDGTEYTTPTNTNNINGLNITITGTTADYDAGTSGKSVNVTANTDVESVYNNFKSFIK